MDRQNVKPSIEPGNRKTLKEWNRDGYKVMKGARHVGRNARGVCVFAASQVVSMKSRTRRIDNEPDVSRRNTGPRWACIVQGWQDRLNDLMSDLDQEVGDW